MRVFWAVLLERHMDALATEAMLDVSAQAALIGATRIKLPFQRTDMARNHICRGFWENTHEDDDAVVMLDADHAHPSDIVNRLTSQLDEAHEVIGALAFRRSSPHDPCYFRASGEVWEVSQKWSGGLEPCTVVGSGAIAIRRSVLRKLNERGFVWPWFRYTYQEGKQLQASEDFDFGLCCEEIGVGHWCDTGCITPHLTMRQITDTDWKQFLNHASRNVDAVAREYAQLGYRIRKLDEVPA